MAATDIIINTRPTMGQIIGATAQYFQISIGLMLSPSRLRKYARPRQIAMYLSYDMTGHSFPSVARQFGKQDHTTAMHAYRSIGELIEIDNTIRTAVDGIRTIVSSRCKGPNLDLPAFDAAALYEDELGNGANKTVE